MENNRIVTLNSNNEVLSNEPYPNAEYAYEAYKEIIEFLKKQLPVGEKITVARFRWNSIMAMETVIGTH